MKRTKRFVKQVGDTEKSGLLRLMRMAHPEGVRSSMSQASLGDPRLGCRLLSWTAFHCICQLHIDKPRHPSWIPKCATQKKAAQD